MKAKCILLTTAAVLIGTAANAATYQVPANFADGQLNVRSGPGTNHALIGYIPAGSFVEAGSCRPRDDRIVGADFCAVRYGNTIGWASRAGLMPVNAQPAPVPTTYGKPDLHGDMVCGAPTVYVGDDPRDTDPVVGVEVNYDASTRNWQVFHHHSSGLVASRSQQYAIEDFSDNNRTRWGGSLNRNRSLYMMAQAGANYTTGEGYYEEWLYNRSQGNRLDMHMRATCRVEIRSATAGPVPMPAPVPVPAPVPAAPAAPVQQTGPTQQNGPIVVPPSNQTTNNNFTIIVPHDGQPRVVPGTTYTPKVKAEDDGS
jgi:uncharacterized protein YraI